MPKFLIEFFQMNVGFFNFVRYSHSQHPSWRIIYFDEKKTDVVTGRSVPLRYQDAMTRAKLFGPGKIEYCRNWKGDLIRPLI